MSIVGLAFPGLAAAAALETLRGDLSDSTSLLIAAVGLEAVALLLGLGLALPALLLARPLARGSVLPAALAIWPSWLCFAYMLFHDRKHDLLGPFPSSGLVQASRAAIALATLALAALLAALRLRARAGSAIGVSILAVAPLVAAAQNRPGPRGGPALLLVTIDTLRADHLGAWGQPLPLSPHIDRLSRRGIVNEEATCQIPITTPSHASILTGLYPPAHSVRGQSYSMSRSVPTLAEALRGAGFRTAAFIAAYPLDSKFGLDRGFQLYDDEFAGTGAARLSPVRLAGLLGPLPQVERSARDVNGRVAGWLARHGSERWFLWVHYFDPHGPYAPPEPFRTFLMDRCRDDLPPEPSSPAIMRDILGPVSSTDIRDARLAYAGEVAETDRAVGDLLARVSRTRGSTGDLTVALLSDHGESLTEHGAYFRHGEDLYEPSLRVPYALVTPGSGSGISHEIVETVDVAPALSRAASIAFPAPPAPRVAAFSESTGAAVHYVPRKVLAVRTPRLKLIRGADDGIVELYDLDADPSEAHDLALRRADVRRPLERLLHGYASRAIEGRHPEPPDGETIERLKALGYLQ